MSDFEYSEKSLADFLSSYFEAINDHKLGLAKYVPEVSDVNTGTAVRRPDTQVSDRFKLTLQYAGQPLTWEVLFNFNFPAEPPDFIFSDGNEDFQPDFEDIKSLCSWKECDPNSLLNVIIELLQQYKEHHLRLLNGTLLESEYSSVVDTSHSTNCSVDDIEVFVARSNRHQRGPVHFYIRLMVSLSSLPEHFNKDKNNNSVALLNVTYQTADGGKVNSRLMFSSHLEQIVAACGIRPMSVPFPQEGCLTDYIVSVQQFLQSQIDAVRISYEKRKELINSFFTVFEGCVLEFDALDFRHISFLCSWNDFSFIVSVKLSSKFPTEQPLIILQSIYHVHRPKNTPYFKTYNAYPYSPRWSGSELAQRIRAYVVGSIQEFQQCSVREGSFCMS